LNNKPEFVAAYIENGVIVSFNLLPSGPCGELLEQEARLKRSVQKKRT
jgi:hypothetical protein